MKSILCFLVFSLLPLLVYGQPVDKNATRKTKILLSNLHEIAGRGIMFGHQDDLAYGIGWKDVEGRSDVLESAGSYPAVHGWDLGSRMDKNFSLDNIRYSNLRDRVVKVYRMGGVNTFSWHTDNLTTNGNSWDTTASVADILPGGIKHDIFLLQLDNLAELFNSFRVGFTKIPVIFRPWHEHNGDWFWWGKGNCSEEEYIRLYRFTVDYLRNEKKLHHVLYAFSPDRSRLRLDSAAASNYLYGYPGDDYVDIIGLDNYGDVGRIGSPDSPACQRENYISSLQLITQIAGEKNKVAALTETGLEGVTNPSWFTGILLDPIREAGDSVRLAWILVWRNANETHHYAPYKGHKSVDDFMEFYQDEITIFQSDLENPYRKNRALASD